MDFEKYRGLVGGVLIIIGGGIVVQAIPNLLLVFSPGVAEQLRDFSPGLLRGLVLGQILVGVGIGSAGWAIVRGGYR